MAPSKNQKNPMEGYNPTNRNFQRPNDAQQSPGSENEETIDDPDPALTEDDLEENNLSVEDADSVEWEEPEGEEAEDEQ